MSDLADRLAAARAVTSGPGVDDRDGVNLLWDGDRQDSDSTLSFHTALDRTFGEAQNLLIRKHRDYGPKNIALAPGGALNGLRVRMWDKLARINHLLDNGSDPSNESLRDSFVDLANYSIIAMLVIDGNWPKGDDR